MLSNDLMVYLVLMILSCVGFCMGFMHVLKVLLMMEFIVINILMIMIFYLNFSFFMSLCLYFLVFSVCEAILGLSLMIFMVRYNGNDYVKCVMINKW